MDTLSTVDNAVDLLFQLASGGEAQGVSALARALELPKASVHRLLATLCRRGLVEKDERRRYRAGPALVALGLGGLDRDPVAAAARAEVEGAARELGETVFLAAPRAGQLLILDKAEGQGFLRASPRVGETIPVHATAIGKLALAHAPEAVPLGAQELVRFTPATATDHAALDVDVRRAALRGWAENRGEWIEGMSVIAAPVFREGRFAAAIAVAAATARLDALGTQPTADRLRLAAARIEERLMTPAPRSASERSAAKEERA